MCDSQICRMCHFFSVSTKKKIYVRRTRISSVVVLLLLLFFFDFNNLVSCIDLLHTRTLRLLRYYFFVLTYSIKKRRTTTIPQKNHSSSFFSSSILFFNSASSCLASARMFKMPLIFKIRGKILPHAPTSMYIFFVGVPKKYLKS